MNQSPIQSFQQITPIVQGVVRGAQSIIKRNKLNYFRSTYITRDITQKQSQSLQQIRATVPKHPYRVCEDPKPTAVKQESIRPFSAQVTVKHHSMHQKKALNIPSTSKILERKNSSRGFVSFHTLKSIKNNQKGSTSSKCIPLKQTWQKQISDDSTIEKLRERKLKAQQYEVKKQKFLDTMNKQLEEYSYDQQRFISSMSRKEYTYNYDGSILQTKHSRAHLKKTRYLPPQVKTLTRNTETPQQKSTEIHVSYRKREDKQNSSQEWLMEEQKNLSSLLCPKSSHTKYSLK